MTIIRVLLKGDQLHNQATFTESSPSTFANFIIALTSIMSLPTETISLWWLWLQLPRDALENWKNMWTDPSSRLHWGASQWRTKTATCGSLKYTEICQLKGTYYHENEVKNSSTAHRALAQKTAACSAEIKKKKIQICRHVQIYISQTSLMRFFLLYWFRRSFIATIIVFHS